MAEVEAILDAAASRHPLDEVSGTGTTFATHALWICSCVTAYDAPTWLIFDAGENEVAWYRVEDRVEPLDLVDARLYAGGHTDPADVLCWLQGKSPDPWASRRWERRRKCG